MCIIQYVLYLSRAGKLGIFLACHRAFEAERQTGVVVASVEHIPHLSLSVSHAAFSEQGVSSGVHLYRQVRACVDEFDQ